ncbi:MAG: alpha/beta fold hydrolase [Gammaproteobacteria bacterium]|nr:alpha/beta fold hydrolase [Gammaproteobacteria bacterium]
MYQRILLIVCLLLAACATPEPPRGLLGAYRLESGETVSVSRSAKGTLRYRIYETGDSGRLYPDGDNTYVSGEGFSNREPVQLTVQFQAGEDETAQTLQWEARNSDPIPAMRIGHERLLQFDSNGAQLFARLQLPDGAPPYPAVVLVHGSGDSPGTEWLYNSDFFVANGIAALTYDKRGSGRSGGEFTFDFHQLARDAVAAVERLLEEPEIDTQRIGLSGYSQGAWVAPLASSMSDSIAFVVVNYGMIESPAEEARLEMRQLLIDADVTDADLADAEQLIAAAVDLVANEFSSGWEEFDTMKKKYSDSKWLDYLQGTPVDQLVSYPKFLVRLLARRRLPKGLAWDYDSTKLLATSNTPMVWLLAQEDRSAPNEQTIAKLRAMEDGGRPIELIVFENADHGMVTFDELNGERVVTRYAAGYFQAEIAAVLKLAQ